jgi:hypothetical protein
MLLKNLPPGKRFPVLFIRFWLDFVSLLKFLADGKFKQARAINKAHMDFLGSLSNHHKKRLNNHQKFNPRGLYKGSIVWDYFVKKRKSFTDLPLDKLN